MFRRDSERESIAVRRDATRPLRNLLITGGCGFIGSNFVNLFAKHRPEVRIINLDILDYCANEASIDADVRSSPQYEFIKGDIANADLVMHIYKKYDIDSVINFAAQSHVDNSFGNSVTFTQTNVLGTHNLLECARVYNKIEKFIHVSTDEVYGEVTESQQEHAMLNPTNPYAATKAAAEFIVKAYHISFGLPCVITRGNNVYGRLQYPEKVIPRFIMLLCQGKKVTIQGEGQSSRTFIHASDVARGFLTVLEKGIIGEIYNIGSRDEHNVKELARRLIGIIKGATTDAEVDRWISYIPDRAFNDLRYDVDSAKLQRLGWEQKVGFEEGLMDAIYWYGCVALPAGFWPGIEPTTDIPPVAAVEAAASWVL